MKDRFRFLGPALACAALCSPTAALANGRFPAAGQVVVDPTDPTRVVLRATFGLMQSTDAGQSWRWICEQSLGYSGIEDPAVGITKNGSIIAGIFEGLTETSDRGCTWAFAQGPLLGEYVVDTAVDPSNPSRALAVTTTTVSGGIHVIVAETLDDGATWAQAGVPIDPSFRALTVEVAPSDAQRIYVSGVLGTATQGTIARSDDHGQTWSMLPVPFPGDAYVSAVDPSDANRLWIRIDGTDQDSLLLSKDGGKTFTSVSTIAGEMLGFALSPDAKTVAIGGPSAGLLLASTADLTFQKAQSFGVRCLRWHATGLYACGDEGSDGFTLARSTDGGGSFTPIYHLADSKLLQCAASTPTGSQCPTNWPAVAAMIGANPSLGAGGGGSGGAAPTPKSDSGCSVSGDERSCAAGAFLIGLAAIASAHRRRRSARRR